jgi:hypothetical protein
MHFSLVALLLLIAGCFGAAPGPYGNNTVAWVLVGIAGLALLLGV